MTRPPVSTTPPRDAQTADWIAQANAMRDRAYVPYSQYAVGAVLVTPDNRIYTGVNVENAAYPSSICAERTALVKAVSEGDRAFHAIAVVTRDGGSPCGQCRQMLYEFAPTLRVIMADEAGRVTFDGPLTDLLPLGFGPAHLLG